MFYFTLSSYLQHVLNMLRHLQKCFATFSSIYILIFSLYLLRNRQISPDQFVHPILQLFHTKGLPEQQITLHNRCRRYAKSRRSIGIRGQILCHVPSMMSCSLSWAPAQLKKFPEVGKANSQIFPPAHFTLSFPTPVYRISPPFANAGLEPPIERTRRRERDLRRNTQFRVFDNSQHYDDATQPLLSHISRACTEICVFFR